jgi:hypothetical protein
MFISYEYQKYLGYDNKTKLYNYRYKIVDDDFEVIDIFRLGQVEALEEVKGGGTLGVIETYEKRNLPVAPNLIKAILWYCDKYGYGIKDIICWNKDYNPKFAKYEKDIEKYLLLL